MAEWDFLANASVDAIDVVPAEYQKIYVEDKATNSFIVNPDLKPLADAYTGVSKTLKNTLAKRTEDNKKDQARRVALEGVQSAITELGIEIPENTPLPDVIKTTFTQLQDSVKGGKEARISVEAAKAEFQKQLKTKDDAHTKELTGLTATLEKHMIESAAATELASANLVDNGIELLMPMIKKVTKLQKQDDGSFKVIVTDDSNNIRHDGNGNEMNIKALVSDLKTKFPVAFKSNQQGGGGLNGTGTKKAVDAKKVGGGDLSAVDKIAAGLEAGLVKGR